MEPAQLLQEVGFPSQSDVAGTRSEEERSESAVDPHQEEAAAAKTSPSLDKRGNLFVLGSDVIVPQERSPSPEYSDAVQEQQSMGETATTRGETNQVEGGGVQRIVLPRDPHTANTSLPGLGVGVRVAGGVMCDKCGSLHTVVTDVASSLNEQRLHKGLAVMEWCGQNVDGASYEEVKRVLTSTEGESNVELLVKECRGPPAETEAKRCSDAPDATPHDEAPHRSPSNSTDRDDSYTPKSLSPSPSPVHSHPGTPTHSVTSTPSPSPPPSPNLLRRGAPRVIIPEPRPASISLPAFREIVKPKFMINDIPTSPPHIVGPIKTYTIESFGGGVPTASIHLSLRYRCEDDHLRILLHEVKHRTKKNGNKHLTSQGHYFINAYLIPDENRQGVRSCDVLSDVTDLVNAQYYTISKTQLAIVALRVVLWETKSKHQQFVGEVLLPLLDGDVVKLQGQPSWFPMCNTDPNLPPLPSPVLPKKTKKEDIFHRVRRGTGYALQSLRRPMSMAIDALAMDGSGRLSSSSSIDNFESSMKKLQAANVTMPRRVKKERRPLSGLFTNSPLHVATGQQDVKVRGTGQQDVKVRDTEQNSTTINGNSFSNPHTEFVRQEIDTQRASLSVPTSPLLTRKAKSAGKDNSRRKKFAGILNALRGSLLHSVDSSRARKRATMDEADGNRVTGGGHVRHWSISGDLKQRIYPLPASSLSAASSPYSSPLHTRTQQVATRRNADTSSKTAPSDELDGGMSYDVESSSDATERAALMDSLSVEKDSSALLSDGSWYSAEEDLTEEGKLKNKAADYPKIAAGRLRTVYTSTRLVKDTDGKINTASKMTKCRSADDILDDSIAFERMAEGEPHLLSRAHYSGDSSASSVDDYNTANSRPLSATSSSDGLGESLDDIHMQSSTIEQGSVASPNHEDVPTVPDLEGSNGSSGGRGDSAAPVSRWRSFDDLLGALPTKLKGLRRNRTHHVFSTHKPSPLLKRQSSEPVFDTGSPVGRVRLELTYNPDTSMIGVRLHEHTLSDERTDLTVQTYLFLSVSAASTTEGQRNTVSFKKTHYSNTLVASFNCDTPLHNMSLQVSLETSGRFFNRRSGHVLLDLGPLLLPSPSLSCDQWFPLYRSPFYPPPNNAPL